MRLGILTYGLPHLKTEQVLHGLLLRGESGLEIYALPFRPRPERKVLFHHRPDQLSAAHPAAIARRFALPYREIATTDDIDDAPETMLVTVGALVTPRLLERSLILNAHAGLIPSVRGLDAFKWAVHDGLPLGTTLHAIDADIDRGTHLLSVLTPVYPDDIPAVLARRHYEAEIAQLVGFRNALAHPKPPLQGLMEAPARKRMPIDAEAVMMERFSAYAKRYAQP